MAMLITPMLITPMNSTPLYYKSTLRQANTLGRAAQSVASANHHKTDRANSKPQKKHFAYFIANHRDLFGMA
jgi:hypothetical protein